MHAYRACFLVETGSCEVAAQLRHNVSITRHFEIRAVDFARIALEFLAVLAQKAAGPERRKHVAPRHDRMPRFVVDAPVIMNRIG